MGLQLEFDGGQLSYVALFTDRHVAEPDAPRRFELAQVTFEDSRGGCHQISRASKTADIQVCFGRPSRIDQDAKETILFYESQGTTMEFEMNPRADTLMRWNLYPTDNG